jgi:hypothetical protein
MNLQRFLLIGLGVVFALQRCCGKRDENAQKRRQCGVKGFLGGEFQQPVRDYYSLIDVDQHIKGWVSLAFCARSKSGEAHHDGHRNDYQYGDGRSIGRWDSPDTVPGSYREDLHLGFAAEAEAGKKAFVEKMIVQICGRWRYLYRGVGQDGSIIVIMVRSRQDRKGTLRFFRKLTTGQCVDRRWPDTHFYIATAWPSAGVCGQSGAFATQRRQAVQEL